MGMVNTKLYISRKYDFSGHTVEFVLCYMVPMLHIYEANFYVQENDTKLETLPEAFR